MVRSIIKLAALIALLIGHAYASTTSVTATLIDSDGTAWAGCTWNATLASPLGRPTIAGAPVALTFASGSCNSSGVLSTTLTDTTSIQQAGATWTFIIQPNASVGPSTITGVVVSGTSQSLSAILSAGLNLLRFQAGSTASGRSAYGYANVEVSPLPDPTAVLGYYNIVSNSACVYSAAGWACGGGSGGAVASVFGRTGAVLPVSGDYTAAQVGALPSSTILPATLGPVAHQWIVSYNASTGLYTQAQPAFTDISGSVGAGQIPATAVTPGSYTNLNATIGADGRITNASNGTGGSVASSANINAANAQILAGSVISTPANGYTAFGDSITAGYGATTAYPALIGTDIGVASPNNQAVSGDTCGDMSYHVFATLNPADMGNPIVTSMCGMNEVLLYGTAALPTFPRYQYASAAWAALSSTNKILASNAAVTKAGTWAADTTFAYANGETSSTAASTLTYTAQVGPSGVFYVWYKMSSTAGTFSLTVGGVTATDTIGGVSPVSTSWTLDAPAHQSAAVGMARFTATPGSHAVVLTYNSGIVTILGFGFPPVTRYRGISSPRYFMGGVTQEGGGANGSIISQFAASTLAVSKQLVTDGLFAPFVDTYNALDTNLDFVSSNTQNCAAGTGTPVHPNQCGQLHLAQVFEDMINAVPQAIAAVGGVTYASADFCDASTTGTSIFCNTGTVTAGDAVVIASATQGTTNYTTFTDSAGGIITQLSGVPVSWSSGAFEWQAYCLPNAAAGAHTITLSTAGASVPGWIAVMGFHGANATNPCSSPVTASGSGTSISAGPVATTIANSAVVGLSINNAANTYSAGSGYTLVASPNGFGLEYAIESAAGSYTPSISLASSASWVETAVVVHP